MKILNKVTLKNLQKNKTRTLVTIVGIILSVSLFTAITTSVYSLQSYVLEVVKEQTGNYHGGLLSLEKEERNKLASKEEVEAVSSLQSLGYARLDGIGNEDKPYLFVGAMDSTFPEMMPVHLVDGALPANSQEILIPEHLSTNGGVNISLGDEITLNLGQRQGNGLRLGQEVSYLKEGEALNVERTKTYKVVGFYERPSFEDYSAPGYTTLTLEDGTGPEVYDVYMRLKKMDAIYGFLEQYPDSGTVVNKDLLRFSGNSNENTLNAVLYSMVAVLSAIIMFGSISLIYNAFSISISERTKQFGLLKSIGATKKQVAGSVFFEAFTLSAVGIPLGILLGITGIGITFASAKELFQAMWNEGTKAELVLRIAPESLLIAAVLGLATVLISAYIPARKASKVSAMEAIRLTQDIKIKARSVKTGKHTYKLFGFTGMLAAKNFKRNRRKYRATVVSLFMSVVLFISASSFTAYLQESSRRVMEGSNYDLSYYWSPDQDMEVEELRALLSSAPGVEASTYEYSLRYASMVVKKSLVEEAYSQWKDQTQEALILGTEEGEQIVDVHLVFLDDVSFKTLLKDNRLSEEEYLKEDAPKGLVYPHGMVFNPEDSRYHTYQGVKEGFFDARLLIVDQDHEGAYFTGEVKGDKLVYRTETEESERLYPREDVIKEQELKLGGLIQELPMMSVNDIGTEWKVIYPLSARDLLLGEVEDPTINLYFQSANHKETYESMTALLKEQNLSYSGLIDHAAFAEQDRALMSVINIFSYGFIVLISLIASANVFNTISTNIHLRRREFAMLKTVGMTKKGFRNMMTFESTLYGLKGILYGIPVAFGATYLIYLSISNGMEFSFFMPWKPVVIAVSSVFLVVFATSIYAMDKIRKDNPIDALRNENI